jgi:hypothetical protein
MAVSNAEKQARYRARRAGRPLPHEDKLGPRQVDRLRATVLLALRAHPAALRDVLAALARPEPT